MNDQTIRFPVTCRACGAESLLELPVAPVQAALFDGQPLRLYAPCHQQWWSANRTELAQIRDYLATVWHAERQRNRGAGNGSQTLSTLSRPTR
jgi:hypothetical protein